MTKKVLLELAVCVAQEILLNGIGRARTLELELVKTKYGGKTVKIVDPFKADRSDFDDAFLGKLMKHSSVSRIRRATPLT